MRGYWAPGPPPAARAEWGVARSAHDGHWFYDRRRLFGVDSFDGVEAEGGVEKVRSEVESETSEPRHVNVTAKPGASLAPCKSILRPLNT